MSDGTQVVVHCGSCGHEWIAAYLPMDASKFAKVLARQACAKCGETKKIFMGQKPPEIKHG